MLSYRKGGRIRDEERLVGRNHVEQVRREFIHDFSSDNHYIACFYTLVGYMNYFPPDSVVAIVTSVVQFISYCAEMNAIKVMVLKVMNFVIKCTTRII